LARKGQFASYKGSKRAEEHPLVAAGHGALLNMYSRRTIGAPSAMGNREKLKGNNSPVI
jgi:hypothetical protein